MLFIDDSAVDVELELRQLERAAFQVTWRLVEDEEALRRALASAPPPDAILSDFVMPKFDGLRALQIAREVAPEVPFLFVSGAIGEERALETLHEGAADYVLKDNLARLPSSVRRAVAHAAERKRSHSIEMETRRLQALLRESEAGLRRAQAVAKLAHVITGQDGAFESWSETFPQLVGIAPAQMPTTTRGWLEFMDAEDRELFREKAIEAARTGARVEVDFRLRRPDGTLVHLHQVTEPLSGRHQNDQPARWFSTLQDVSEQKDAEIKIKRLNRVYAVLSGINSLIVRAPQREELFAEACRITVEVGRFPMSWIGLLDRRSMRVAPVAMFGCGKEILQDAYWDVSEGAALSEGLVYQAVKNKQAVISNDIAHDRRVVLRDEFTAVGVRSVVVLPLVVGTEVVGVFTLVAAEVGFFDEVEMKLLLELAGDIAFAIDHIEKGERLNYLAYYDSLTGLANRTLFLERLAQKVQGVGAAGHRLGIFAIDIERFRTINDAFGRHAGDEVLLQVAERFKAASGGAAHLGRISADVFCMASAEAASDEEAGRYAENLLGECFGTPYRMGDQELRLSARVGIAMFPADGQDAEALFSKAEAALRKAKEAGERYLFHTEEMTARIAERLSLENKLRQALEKDEFVLHYQPKVEFETGVVVGMEALMRWQSPELGLVPPARFIPLLEETGLILPVGAWALRRASLDHRRWVEQGLKPSRVAVNVSAIQLRQRDFVAVVEQAIMEGVAPTGIDLEITETLVMEDIQRNIEKLESVRGLGVRISIDDFGTGYSSLGYLAKLPVESLKIDRSFIVSMDEDANAMTLVSTIISLAHSLRLKVVAEGVETEAQAKFLRLLRCDQMQGYLFSKPLPNGELVKLLQSVASTRGA